MPSRSLTGTPRSTTSITSTTFPARRMTKTRTRPIPARSPAAVVPRSVRVPARGAASHVPLTMTMTTMTHHPRVSAVQARREQEHASQADCPALARRLAAVGASLLSHQHVAQPVVGVPADDQPLAGKRSIN